MQAAPLPINETKRLKTLRQYEILDTLPEEDYDRITRLASIIVGTPIAVVALIDEERQWFKSHVGLDSRETPRDVALCAHAILEPERLMVVNDTHEDKRFFDNPLVTGGKKIRFYAGAPLQVSSGETFGTLCVIDVVPRTLTPEQAEALRLLADQVTALLEIHLRRNDLQRLSESLEKTLAQLAQSNTDLERFAYVASHDMQEPLRMIASFGGLLRQEFGDKLDSTGLEYLTFVTEGSKRMQALVEDLLSYSRLKGEEASLVSVDMELELQHVLDNMSGIIADRKAVVTHEPLPRVKGNPVQLMRLMQNLIGNGLKYQSGQTAPAVHIAAEDKSGHWVFSVRDNGIGIDMVFATKIFEPFKRLHTWGDYKGSGIGLAVCKQIVEKHGGAIWLSSEPGKGSTFYFTLAKDQPAKAKRETA